MKARPFPETLPQWDPGPIETMGPVWSPSQTWDETMPSLPVPWEGRPSGHCRQLMDSIFPMTKPPADCVIFSLLNNNTQATETEEFYHQQQFVCRWKSFPPHKSQRLTLGGGWMNAASEQWQHSAGGNSIYFIKREAIHFIQQEQSNYRRFWQLIMELYVQTHMLQDNKRLHVSLSFLHGR